MKEISRRDFLLFLSGVGVVLVSSQKERRPSPEEKLQEVLNFMAQSEVPEIATAANNYYSLQKSPVEKLQITDHFKFNQEPISVQFVGGLGGDSDWQIVVAKGAIFDSSLSNEAWAIYLYKTMLLFKIADATEGTAQQEVTALANRSEVEARVWQQVWETVDKKYIKKTADPYLINLFSEHQLSLNPTE